MKSKRNSIQKFEQNQILNIKDIVGGNELSSSIKTPTGVSSRDYYPYWRPSSTQNS